MTRPRWCLLVVPALVLAIGAVSAAAAQTAPSSAKQQARQTTGAVYTGDFADPSALTAGGRYYAYATQADGFNIQVLVSGDLTHWGNRRDALPALPTWASPGYTWAPSVAKDPSGGYEMFFAARDRASGLRCIGRATSSSPLGPFIDRGDRPFVCQTSSGGSIDPYVFTDSGVDYLIWKGDGAAGQPQQLWAQLLGAGDTSLVGSSSLLLSATSTWEAGVVEGPAMLRTGSGLFLYFSGDRWSSAAYAIGVVGCDTPLGPCVNAPTGTEVSVASHVIGPGGPSFFTTTDGQTMMAYAAWSSSSVPPRGRRQLYLDKVDTTGTSPTLTQLLVAAANSPASR